MTPAIEVAGLTKRFGDLAAVDGLSFAVPRGRVTGFLGPNGAGKTTTMRVVLGLAEPTEGVATILGRRYAALDQPLAHVGAMLESTGFHPGRTGRDHLHIAARAGSIDRERIDAVLDQVAMREYADRRVGGYSSGMRQRLGLATALLGDPEVLVLDEPGNGLDPAGVAWLRGFLRAFAGAGGYVFVSSHLLAEMAQTVDRRRRDRPRPARAGGTRGGHHLVGGPGRARAIARRGRGSAPPWLRRARRFLAGDDSAAISVAGLPIERVGEIAATEGAVLHELRGRAASLEEAFLQLTGGEGGEGGEGTERSRAPAIPPPPEDAK